MIRLCFDTELLGSRGSVCQRNAKSAEASSLVDVDRDGKFSLGQIASCRLPPQRLSRHSENHRASGVTALYLHHSLAKPYGEADLTKRE
jgi:hypothetical protein